MRVTLSILALFIGLCGAYMVGSGIFSGESATQMNWSQINWMSLLKPFSDANPLACLLLTVSVALGIFSLAIASGHPDQVTPVRASHIFIWGGIFSVLTSAGFSILLYILWKDGASTGQLGLVFSLASVQACLGLILGGAAMLSDKSLRLAAAPVLAAGLLETSMAGVMMAWGYTF